MLARIVVSVGISAPSCKEGVDCVHVASIKRPRASQRRARRVTPGQSRLSRARLHVRAALRAFTASPEAVRVRLVRPAQRRRSGFLPAASVRKALTAQAQARRVPIATQENRLVRTAVRLVTPPHARRVRPENTRPFRQQEASAVRVQGTLRAASRARAGRPRSPARRTVFRWHKRCVASDKCGTFAAVIPLRALWGIIALRTVMGLRTRATTSA